MPKMAWVFISQGCPDQVPQQDGLDNRNLFSSCSRDPKSKTKVPAGLVLEALREGPFRASLSCLHMLPAVLASCGWQTYYSSFSLRLHIFPVFLCPNFPLIKAPVIVIAPPATRCDLGLMSCAKALFPGKVTVIETGHQDLNTGDCWDTTQPTTVNKWIFQQCPSSWLLSYLSFLKVAHGHYSPGPALQVLPMSLQPSEVLTSFCIPRTLQTVLSTHCSVNICRI